MNTVRLLKIEFKKENQLKLALLLIVIFSVFVLSEIKKSVTLGMSTLEFMLYSMSNHNFIMYGWFIVLLFWCSHDIKSGSYYELVRIGSTKRFNQVKLLSAMIKFAFTILLLNIISFFIARIYLHHGNEFRSNTTDVYYLIFTQFPDPLVASCVVSGFLWLGSVFLYQLLFLVKQFRSKNVFIGSIISVLCSAFVGFGGNLDEGAFGVLFFNNYIIFHHSFFVASRTTFVAILIVMVGMIVSVFVEPRQKRRIAHHGEQYLHSLLVGDFKAIVLGILLLIVPLFLNAVVHGDSSFEVMFKNIRGYSSSKFQFTEFMIYIWVLVLPMFSLSLLWEKEKMCLTSIAMIRFPSKKAWDLEVERMSILFLNKYIFTYFLILTSASLIFHLLFHNNSAPFIYQLLQHYGITEGELGVVSLISIGLKILELYFLYFVTRILFKWTNNAVFCFLGSFVGYGATFFDVNINIIPFGISSVYRMLEFREESLINYCMPLVLSLGLSIIINNKMEVNR